MTEFNPFVVHTAETAPVAVRAALDAAAAKLGVVPAALALLANSPTALAAFEGFTASFARSALAPVEREVVIMVVARENECELCVAMHTRLLRAAHADDALIAALRAGEALADPRLEALRGFTHAALAHRGAVPDAPLRAFLAAGYSPEQALDVVVGIAAYTLSTFANRLTRAPIERFLERDRWHKVTPAGEGAAPA